MEKELLKVVDWRTYFENNTDYQQDIIDYIDYMGDLYFGDMTVEADTLVKIFGKLSEKQINKILDNMKYDFTLEENTELELLLKLNNYTTSRSPILFEADYIRNNNNMGYTDMDCSYVLEELTFPGLSKDIELEKVVIYLNGYIEDYSARHNFRRFDLDVEYYNRTKENQPWCSRRILHGVYILSRLSEKDIKEMFISRNKDGQLDNIVNMIQEGLVERYGTVEHLNEALLKEEEE